MLVQALTLQAQVRWPTTTPYSSLAACIKVLAVLTSTWVENYSLAAVLVTAKSTAWLKLGQYLQCGQIQTDRQIDRQCHLTW